MNTPSAITFRAHSPVIVLRRDFLEICEGDHCAAVVLGQMFHWHSVKAASVTQAHLANERRRATGQPGTQDTSLWVWKSAKELHDEIMEQYGLTKVRAAYQYLQDRGFLLSRSNPHDQWDKTRQYLFVVEAVQNAINALPVLEEPTVAPADDETLYQNWNIEAPNLIHRSDKSNTSDCRGEISRSTKSDASYKDNIQQITSEKTATESPRESVSASPSQSAGNDLFSAADSMPDSKVPNAEPDADLLAQLVEAGLNRSDAVRLAASYQDECRRQLAFLPFVNSFKSSRGAYLRSAIEQGFAPPREWQKAQDEATRRAKHARPAPAKNDPIPSDQTTNLISQEKMRIENEHPALWADMIAEAEKLMPPPLRGKTSHVAYQGALNGNIERLIAARLAVNATAGTVLTNSPVLMPRRFS